MVRRLLAIGLLALVVSCGEPGRADVDLDDGGDTVSTSGAWGDEVHLVEELSVGAIDGPDEYVFGGVTEITPDGAGGFFAFDRRIPALRQYDENGRFIRTLGAEGEGPGEYSDAILGLTVLPDGRLAAYDAKNSRINLYRGDGTPSDHWAVTIGRGLFVGRQLLSDSTGHVYVKILAGELQWPMPWPWPIGLLHLDEHGQVVDTIPPPSISGEPTSSRGPLSVEKVWAQGPRTTVVGVNDEYSFEIRRPDGEITKVVRPHRRLGLENREWRAYETRRLWEARKEGKDLPRTPRTKPAFRAFRIGAEGHIWVQKYMPVTFRDVEPPSDHGAAPPFPFEEPAGFDVFDSDGTYMGAVLVPNGVDLLWIGPDRVFGVRKGELDEQYVVRLRLEHR